MNTEILYITVGSHKLTHNTAEWRVRVSGCSASGDDHGYIDGTTAPTSWSNEPASGMLTERQANAVVAEHNEWLVKHTPPIYRLVEAKTRYDAIEARIFEIKENLREYEAMREEALAKLDKILESM